MWLVTRDQVWVKTLTIPVREPLVSSIPPRRTSGSRRGDNRQCASLSALAFFVTAQQSSRFRRLLAKSINNWHGAEKFACAKANPCISSQSLCGSCQELIWLITKSSFEFLACPSQRREQNPEFTPTPPLTTDSKALSTTTSLTYSSALASGFPSAWKQVFNKPHSSSSTQLKNRPPPLQTQQIWPFLLAVLMHMLHKHVELFNSYWKQFHIVLNCSEYPHLSFGISQEMGVWEAVGKHLSTEGRASTGISNCNTASLVWYDLCCSTLCDELQRPG